jgi:hypothetical protein
MVVPAFAGEDPYVAYVDKDTIVNPFYLSPKYAQFLYDETTFVPLGGEEYLNHHPRNQPEICDTNGTATYNGQIPEPPFIDVSKATNSVIRANNQGWFRWKIKLPKKPSGQINVCIQCGVLKPDAFKFWGYDAVLACAAETGERIGDGLCVRREVDPGQNPLYTPGLPQIEVTARRGAYAPYPWNDFHLTAFKNPSSYNIAFDAATGAMINDAATQVLDGSINSRILLKTCMDKCVVAKLPVTGQRNALGETEFDLEAGDIIDIYMFIPRANTVDVYCHRHSAKIMGVGEDWY